MPTQIHQVDAFTDQPFRGNPAAVCVLSRPASEPWMQAVAAEMNLSETAFLHREGEIWRLRWFTPVVEVALCGHATLAAAHVLWGTGVVARRGDDLTFETLSGRLGARFESGRIELDFPEKRTEAAAPPAGLLESLGVGKLRLERLEWDPYIGFAALE